MSTFPEPANHPDPFEPAPSFTAADLQDAADERAASLRGRTPTARELQRQQHRRNAETFANQLDNYFN